MLFPDCSVTSWVISGERRSLPDSRASIMNSLLVFLSRSMKMAFLPPNAVSYILSLNFNEKLFYMLQHYYILSRSFWYYFQDVIKYLDLCIFYEIFFRTIVRHLNVFSLNIGASRKKSERMLVFFILTGFPPRRYERSRPAVAGSKPLISRTGMRIIVHESSRQVSHRLA